MRASGVSTTLYRAHNWSDQFDVVKSELALSPGKRNSATPANTRLDVIFCTIPRTHRQH